MVEQRQSEGQDISGLRDSGYYDSGESISSIASQ